MRRYVVPTLLSPGMGEYATAEWHDYYAEIVCLVPNGARVLDIGSGRGGLAAFLERKRGCSVVCLDASEEAIAACSEKGLPAQRIDIDREDPSVDAGFDVILFSSSLESLVDPLGVVRRVRQLLASQGRVVIWLPNFAYIRALVGYLRGKAPKCVGYSADARGLGVRGYDDVQFFTKQTLETMLLEAGYTGLEWHFRDEVRRLSGRDGGARSGLSRVLKLRPLARLRFLLSPSLCVVASVDDK